MNNIERRAVFSLSSILALRMLGLFMALPLLSLYALNLIHATPLLVGLTAGIYGLTQALFQLPFGALSDRIGRKKIITIGLILFTIGSLVAALSESIWGMLIGRALQGTGAIGSATIALIADMTREEQRSKAMAISGMMIGFSFSLAMLLGPIAASIIQVNGIFFLAAGFSLIAMLLLWFAVPQPEKTHFPSQAEQNLSFSFIKSPELLRLNLGVFLLHMIFTANFVVIPISLQTLTQLNGQEQWLLYLPILLIAFAITIPCIMIAEKKQWVKTFFLSSVVILGTAECFFWIFANKLLLSALSLLLFFIAFSLLEAFLPSLVSKAAPQARKGTALGIYSFSQFLGIFAGGTVGGWIYGEWNLIQVYLLCAILALIWWGIAFGMKNP